MRRALVTALISLAGACEGPFVPPPASQATVASVTLSPHAAVIRPGDTLRLQFTLRDASGDTLAGPVPAFTSRDLRVTTVSDDGLVRAVAFGTAWIVVAADGHTDSTIIRVASLTFASISAGGNHTCGTTTDGAVLCWGYNRYGQTGDGQTGAAVRFATPVVGLTGAEPVAGGNHTCALQGGGGATMCWGWNQSGQLGTATPGDRSEPALVIADVTFTALTAGGQHTCALTESGEAYCWGLNADGQVGDTSFHNQFEPVPVAAGLRFTTLSAGGRHTCGITTDSLAYCWGANEFGQVGDSTTTHRSSPTRVAGDYRFVAIASGRFHSCALTAAGAAYCWGYNGRHQLGTATPDSAAHQPVAVDGTQQFATVTAGGLHTCALLTDGTAYCWGHNALGQVGDSTTADASAPTAVRTAAHFVTLHTFGDHTCGMSTTGRAYCWGFGGTGELGTGLLAGSTYPVLVAGQP